MELSRNLKVESVSRLWPTPPRSVESDRPISEAVATMRKHKVGCLLVTTDGKLSGIFTERDLLVRVLAARVSLDEPVRNCMTSDPVTVGPKDPIRAALQKMQSGSYRHLPVIDTAHRPIGILSAKRIVRYLVEHFPATVYNQPPNPSDAHPPTAEGA